MTEPIRISCRDPDDLPPASRIEAAADGGHHVVLEFLRPDPAERESFDASEVVRRLTAALPEYFTAFDSGGRRGVRTVTLMRVISEPRVVANQEVILAAVRAYRAVAGTLLQCLAAKLGLPVSAFDNPLIRFDLAGRDDGPLDETWAYSFHGMECRFTNRVSGQDIEVPLGNGAEPRGLDPYFFHRFLATTPEFAEVAALFGDSFHDPRRALDILRRRGKLGEAGGG